jgi:hypothetical protein
MQPRSPCGKYDSIGSSSLSALSIINSHGFLVLDNQFLAAISVGGSFFATFAIALKECFAISSEDASTQNTPQKLKLSVTSHEERRTITFAGCLEQICCKTVTCLILPDHKRQNASGLWRHLDLWASASTFSDLLVRFSSP